MHETITRLMDWRAGLLQTGRVEDLARQHICPMPIYVDGQMRPMPSARHLEQTFRQIHAALRDRGTSALTVAVRAVELPRGGRFRVWCDWLAPRAGVPPTLLASTVDYLRQTEAGLMTEMLECRCRQAAHRLPEPA